MPKTERSTVVHETSSSATLEDQEASPATSSDKIKSSSNTIKTKNTKSQSKAKIINHENSSKLIDNESNEEQDFDLQLSIEEAGGLKQFLESPSVILYRKKLKSQGKSPYLFYFEHLHRP
ncbi:unnamed protein product [Rotaria sordida]|uniref:Uncharacterized protein n=2 Tax=Rotaria sordida TaxID=392033 RepID=A0A820E847_9BILA|nr:unnamed protein product [Rotaria sordida]